MWSNLAIGIGKIQYRSTSTCWETKYYIADLESFPFMSPIRVCTSVFKFSWSQTPGCSGLCWWGFLQAGQIQTRQRLMEDANKKCGNIRRDSYSTESACRWGVNAPACLVEEQCTVSKPDAASQHNRLSLSILDIWTLCQYVINRTRQITVRDLSCCIAPHLV